MGIPLTLASVITGISDQILSWERHSWVDCAPGQDSILNSIPGY